MAVATAATPGRAAVAIEVAAMNVLATATAWASCTRATIEKVMSGTLAMESCQRAVG